MSEQVLAALVGTTATSMKYLSDVSDRARKARNAGEDAQDKADEALRGVEEIASSGALQRSSSASVADFEVGLAYPAQQAAQPASPYATVPQPTIRPVFTELDATDVQAYPGSVSAYLPNGKLRNPSEATGQNVKLGMAARFAEVRASILGLTQSTEDGQNLSSIANAQFFRFFRALGLVLRALVTSSAPNGMSETEMGQAIGDMLQGSRLFKRIADFFSAAGIVITNTAAETAFQGLSIPAGAVVNPGDRIYGELNGLQVSTNAADTTQIRLRKDGLAGTVAFDSGLQSAPTGKGLSHKFTAVYLGNNQLRVDSVLLFQTSVISQTVIAFDPAVGCELTWTAQHSAANAANQTAVFDGTLFLSR